MKGLTFKREELIEALEGKLAEIRKVDVSELISRAKRNIEEHETTIAALRRDVAKLKKYRTGDLPELEELYCRDSPGEVIKRYENALNILRLAQEEVVPQGIVDIRGLL